jgi:hypothetical protein
MALFFISYDLMTPGKDYQRLYDKLAALGGQRVLLSLWALRGNYSATSLRDTLKSFIDSNDRLLVDESNNWASYGALVDINKI